MGYNVKIDRLKIRNEGSLMCYADVNLNDKLTIKGCRLIESDRGRFVAMPSYKGNNDKYYPHVWVNDEGLREAIREAVVAAYEKETTAPPPTTTQSTIDDAPASPF